MYKAETIFWNRTRPLFTDFTLFHTVYIYHILFTYRFVREEIKRASKQIVAGTMYRISVNMVKTSCKNNDENSNKKIEDCPSNANCFPTLCKFTVWSKLGNKPVAMRIVVTEMECNKDGDGV